MSAFYYGYHRLQAWGLRVFWVPLDSVLVVDMGCELPVREGFRVDGVARIDGVLRVG